MNATANMRLTQVIMHHALQWSTATAADWIIKYVQQQHSASCKSSQVYITHAAG